MDANFISRTPAGLIAESLLRDVSYIVHVEGKGNSPDIKKLPDYIFYNALLKNYLDGRYEIRIEGGKENLKQIAARINGTQHTENNHIVFMDRDHNEALGINDQLYNFVHFTHGYSFENDLWTTALLKKILRTFCPNNDDVDIFINKWKKLERKVAYIHKLNLISRTNNMAMFNLDGLCGILFHERDGELIIKDECIQRLKSKWKGFNIGNTQESRCALLFLHEPFYSHPGYLIQGHAFESYVLEVTHMFYKQYQIGNSETKNNNLFKTIALSSFSEAPGDYLSGATINYYRRIFTSLNSN